MVKEYFFFFFFGDSEEKDFLLKKTKTSECISHHARLVPCPRVPSKILGKRMLQRLFHVPSAPVPS